MKRGAWDLGAWLSPIALAALSNCLKNSLNHQATRAIFLCDNLKKILCSAYTNLPDSFDQSLTKPRTKTCEQRRNQFVMWRKMSFKPDTLEKSVHYSKNHADHKLITS